MARTGIAWEYPPHDFPPAKTVYDYYAKREADGTTQRIHDLLRERVRTVRGRSASPSAVVLDSQSVKTSSNVGKDSQGIDAAKKIKGRKRHIATDTLGLLLAARGDRHRCVGAGLHRRPALAHQRVRGPSGRG